MPPILTQKSSVVALVSLIVGIICHIRGASLSDSTNADISQVVGLIFDLVAGNIIYVLNLHLKNKQGIATIDPTAVNTPSPMTPAASSINTTGTVAKLLILGTICAYVTGCASFGQLSDQDKVSQSESVFTVAVTALSAAKGANLIDAQDYHSIVGIEQTLSAAFDQVHADLDAGGKLDGNTAWNVINTMLNQITAYQWRFTHGTGNPGGNSGPTTIPSSRGPIGDPIGKQRGITDRRTTVSYRNTA